MNFSQVEKKAIPPKRDGLFLNTEPSSFSCFQELCLIRAGDCLGVSTLERDLQCEGIASREVF